MQRGRFLNFMNGLFLLVGLGSIFCSLRIHELMPNTRESVFTGGVLLLLAGISGLLAAAYYRRQTRRLIETIRQATIDGRVRFTETHDAEITPLINGMNEIVDLSERAVADAVLKCTELEIELKVINVQRQHAEAILHSISDAVVVTDQFDDIRSANESAARIFDFDLTKAIRQPVERVLRDPTIVSIIREMRQSDSKSGRRILEHKMKSLAGERAYKITLSCVTDPTDDARTGTATQTSGVVAVLHDVTKEKEVAEMKSDFVSHVSHELRTPLASIKAYVEMLIDGEASEPKTQREFYDVIQNEANRLGRLIDNILNISRIESGLVRVEKKPQSLTVILKEALEVISPQAKNKHIKLVEHLPPAFYQTSADKDMLYQAMLNLLSNAVKYTADGGTITVGAEVEEARRLVKVTISDTGAGIPRKDLPFVFDKFYRVQANNRMAKGTGLGLSLVKQIIEGVHGGRVSVQSEVGKGSRFEVELKLSE